MARRIERNAHSEGVSETPRPPPPQGLSGPLPPSAMAAMQPNMPVQVFPTGVPPPPPPIPPSNGTAHAPRPPPMKATSPVNTPQQQYQRPDIKIPTNPTAMLRPTAGINRPHFEDFDQLEPKIVSPQTMSSRIEPSSPETQTSTAQLGSLYIPPVEMHKQVTPPAPPQRQIQSPTSPQSPIQGLNKAPTPWLQKQPVQQTVPAWAVRGEQVSSPSPQVQSPQSAHNAPTWAPSPPTSAPPGARILPMQYEAAMQQQQQQRMMQQQAYQQQQQRTESTTTRIIPIQIEGQAPRRDPPPQTPNSAQMQQRQPVYMHNKYSPSSGASTPCTPGTGDSDRMLNRQPSWSSTPTQSNAFRMLQKMTSTEGEDVYDDDLPVTEHGPRQGQQMLSDQVRKLNLTDSDRQLMNRVRQVSEDASFWQDDDLRYRGGHIPSRVFRLLDESVPRGQPNTRGPPQMREHIIHTQIEGDGPAKPYIPPSEQTVQEPRKYTGSAIPSRSFKMLQAMTAPENCGPDQSDL